MGVYRSLLRPALFALPPETSHHLAEIALRLPAPWRSISGSTRMPEVPTDLAGITLRNPIGLAAGFDKDCRELGGLSSLGFGYLVGGTVSRGARSGNERPRIVRDTRAGTLVNGMGIPNQGAEAIAARLRVREPDSTPLFVSLADEQVEDVVFTHALLAPLVDAIEFNVSSPNSPWRHDRDDNTGYLKRALAELVPARVKPIFVKLPPFRTEEERREVLELARIGAEAGVDGFTCSNTRPVPDVRLARGRGGLSGRSLMADTPRIVEEIVRATDLPVNACGGISSAEDARRCLDAGARTVQVYTALIFEGPRVVRAIASGLAATGPPGAR